MLESRIINDVNVVRLSGTDRLTSYTAEEVKAGLIEFFSRPGTRLVFDLDGVHYIDSSGFSLLLSTLKEADNHHGTLKICNAGKEVMQLFSLLQLHHVFEIYTNLDECLESFTNR